MSTSIYEMPYPPEVAPVLEELRQRIAKVAGVTLTGNRLTVRWDMADKLVDVHMVIVEVTTPQDADAIAARQGRYDALIAKYKKKLPDLAEDLFFAETGEHTQ